MIRSVPNQRPQYGFQLARKVMDLRRPDQCQLMLELTAKTPSRISLPTSLHTSTLSRYGDGTAAFFSLTVRCRSVLRRWISSGTQLGFGSVFTPRDWSSTSDCRRIPAPAVAAADYNIMMAACAKHIRPTRVKRAHWSALSRKQKAPDATLCVWYTPRKQRLA